jgi:hypothetical protein
MDSTGYRIAAAGLVTADGAGNVTNTTLDVNDNGAALTLFWFGFVQPGNERAGRPWHCSSHHSRSGRTRDGL